MAKNWAFDFGEQKKVTKIDDSLPILAIVFQQSIGAVEVDIRRIEATFQRDDNSTLSLSGLLSSLFPESTVNCFPDLPS